MGGRLFARMDVRGWSAAGRPPLTCAAAKSNEQRPHTPPASPRYHHRTRSVCICRSRVCARVCARVRAPDTQSAGALAFVWSAGCREACFFKLSSFAPPSVSPDGHRAAHDDRAARGGDCTASPQCKAGDHRQCVGDSPRRACGCELLQPRASPSSAASHTLSAAFSASSACAGGRP